MTPSKELREAAEKTYRKTMHYPGNKALFPYEEGCIEAIAALVAHHVALASYTAAMEVVKAVEEKMYEYVMNGGNAGEMSVKAARLAAEKYKKPV